MPPNWFVGFHSQAKGIVIGADIRPNKDVTSADFVINSKPQSLIAMRREKEDNHEAEEVTEEDSATRKISTRRLRETGQIKKQTAAGGNRKGVEGCEKIGGAPYCISWNEVFGINYGREETQAETESFTGTSGSTCSRDESTMGRKASCRGE
jgi:hypothetical protein